MIRRAVAAALALSACTSGGPAEPSATASADAPTGAADLLRLRPDAPIDVVCTHETAWRLWDQTADTSQRDVVSLGLVGAVDGVWRYTRGDHAAGDLTLAAHTLAISLPIGDVPLIEPDQPPDTPHALRVEGHDRAWTGTSTWHDLPDGCVQIDVVLDAFADGAAPAVGTRDITSRWCPGLLEVERRIVTTAPGGTVTESLRCEPAD